MKKALILLSLLTLPLTLLPTPSTANAVTAADWKPGRIIDDFIFTNKSAMTVAQIQQFLDAKLTTCDTKGVQQITYRYSTTTKRIGQSGDPYATTSRALYAYRYHMYIRLYRENPDPSYPLPPVATTKPESIPDAEDVWYTTNTNMVCLKNYYENTTTKATNYASGVIPSGAISAAQIIWDASQRYNISPQVLLVTLQKEQNLIGDDWPWPYQIRAATGYACSDSAPCEAQYYGLFNQIENAAWQFNNYMVNPQFFIYRAGVTRFISYQANNPGCGGTNVFIENAATAALYNYTPYQPNQASLNNLYGTGDGCSAYGNRNFWRLFSDWFGSTNRWTCGNAIRPIDYDVDFGKYTSTYDQPALQLIAGTSTDCIESHVWNQDMKSWKVNLASNRQSIESPGANTRFGDIDGDGKDEQILILSTGTSTKKIEFHVWNQDMKSWKVNVASNHPLINPLNSTVTFGDIDGDGKDEPILVHMKSSGSGKIEFHVWNQDMKSWKVNVASNQSLIK